MWYDQSPVPNALSIWNIWLVDSFHNYWFLNGVASPQISWTVGENQQTEKWDWAAMISICHILPNCGPCVVCQCLIELLHSPEWVFSPYKGPCPFWCPKLVIEARIWLRLLRPSHAAQYWEEYGVRIILPFFYTIGNYAHERYKLYPTSCDFIRDFKAGGWGKSPMQIAPSVV